MKITIEFDEHERDEAEMAVLAPQFAAAASDFDHYLRTKSKHGEHSEEVHAMIEDLQKYFYDCFNGLIR